jgi:hypothetical protein
VDATTQPGEPSCSGSTATVWYAFTPTVSQPIAINTFGSIYGTMLAVYTGEPCSLEQIACDDDFGGPQSQVNFNATAGETYYIQAGSFPDRVARIGVAGVGGHRRHHRLSIRLLA